MQQYAYATIKTELRVADDASDANDQAMKARLDDLARWGSMGYRITHRDEIETAGTRTIYETLERTSE